jgi:hypothetical protein
MAHKNKKAISEIVSYVLLIIIAVGIAVLVYAFLRLYVPRERLSCPDDINLAIANTWCVVNPDGGVRLHLTLENKGLFNVTDYYARIASQGKQAKLQLNQGKTSFPRPLSPGGDPVSIEFHSTPEITSGIYAPLLGDVINLSKSTAYTLEIQPAVQTDKGLALCSNAIITETITCG